ncbi:MAG: hypothetical protein FWF60_06385, partial [Oscillospiraceae bacterium]|nr:hypothetical protein [Oscillospiraceae bacterium]
AAALAFLLCFLLSVVLAEAFVLAHASHKHDHAGPGGGCAVCAQLQSIGSLRRQGGTAAARAPMVWVGLFAVLALLCCAAGLPIQTPVALKIRLND